MIELLDVSGIQDPANADWKAVAASGVRGVWLQASRYKGQVEASFLSGMNAAKAAGLAVGAYHFAYCGSSAPAQARFAFSACKGLGSAAGDLPPMLDWEFIKNKDDGTAITPEESVAWAESFMATAQELWYPSRERKPVMYTFPYFAGQHQPHLANSSLGAYPLVLAAYGENNTPYVGTPKPVAPWDKVTVHQYIGNGGRVHGIQADCDRDRMDCTEEEFQKFLGNVTEYEHTNATFTETT
jgi:lysozyme